MDVLGAVARVVTSRIGYLRGVPELRLSGATVVVTGGARGIGACAAAEFAAAGAQVWLADLDSDVAAETAARIPGARAVALDVADLAMWQALVEEVGDIDILVNNAGVMPAGPLADEPDELLNLVLDVNVRGMLLGMQTVLPSMAARGRGHVVNVASLAGMIPLPGLVAYNASKYAAYGASLAARREYDGTGVTISAILPSAVRTELSSGAKLGGALPTVDPEDVARAVVGTVTTRAARTSVPGWIAPMWDLTAFVPETIERFARRLVSHDQAMNLDGVARASYQARISGQAVVRSVLGR